MVHLHNFYISDFHSISFNITLAYCTTSWNSVLYHKSRFNKSHNRCLQHNLPTYIIAFPEIIQVSSYCLFIIPEPCVWILVWNKSYLESINFCTSIAFLQSIQSTSFKKINLSPLQRSYRGNRSAIFIPQNKCWIMIYDGFFISKSRQCNHQSKINITDIQNFKIQYQNRTPQ